MITDEAVDAAIAATRNSCLVHDYTASPTDLRSDMRTALGAAFPHVFFAPNGDNHHNALLCPYCTPRDRVTFQLEPERAQRLLDLLGNIDVGRNDVTRDFVDAQHLREDLKLMMDR